MRLVTTPSRLKTDGGRAVAKGRRRGEVYDTATGGHCRGNSEKVQQQLCAGGDDEEIVWLPLTSFYGVKQNCFSSQYQERAWTIKMQTNNFWNRLRV